MKAVFVWFPEKEKERTHWVNSLEQIPRVGDGVALGDGSIPIMDVRRVLWVYNNDLSWHAEITLGTR